MTTLTIQSHTNSSLSCARRCVREWYLRYLLRLERDVEEEREPLAVGTCWHAAHEAFDKERGPHKATFLSSGEAIAEGAMTVVTDRTYAVAYNAINDHAPSPLWAVKLSRLFAAYHWYWQSEPLNVVESELKWSAEILGRSFEGKSDGVVQLADGRCGLLERKTTSDSLEAESLYWQRLRLDAQVGIYAMAMQERPSFILYDVVRKPTINPKNLAKKDAARLRSELTAKGTATYFGEEIGSEEVERALFDGRETPALYGARLTADIGDRPEHYFARREVPRTEQDYASLADDLNCQVAALDDAVKGKRFPRNPDACAVFGTCDFFGICSNNVYPTEHDHDGPPEGYRVREHTHPELA